MASFALPSIHDNADGSWGPATSDVPKRFQDVPYAPFSKSDKITHVADFIGETSTDGAAATATTARNARGGRGGGGARGNQREAYGASTAAATGNFGFERDEDERSFSLVDAGRVAGATRSRGTGLFVGRGRGRGGFTRGGAAGGRGGRGGAQSFGSSRGINGAYRGRGRGGYGGYNSWDKASPRMPLCKSPQRIRDWSITIGNDWDLLEEISFTRLQKLSLPVQLPEDLSIHGTIYSYNKQFDGVNTRNEKPLEVKDMLRYNTTTSDDPVINELAQKEEAQIYTTDAILSVLMTATRSVNSWDIVITKEGNNIYFDKREGGPFDFVTVNENAQDPPAEAEKDKADNINSPGSLSLEATYINSNFASQIVDDSKKKAFKNPNPFYSAEETEPLASCAYRYRKFDVSVGGDEEPINMVVRTEIDAYSGKKDQYITIKALNEFDSKAQGSGKAPDWRSKLDTQRGAVIATEMKNNSAKLARWTVQALLAGVEAMKLGFVSRAKPTDAQRHSILLVQTVKPRDVATQMNVSLNNGWGIVRMLIDRLRKQEDGRFVLVKDPNNPMLRLYSLPEGDGLLEAVDEEADAATEDAHYD
ncbi:hypothetical protein QFC24_005956 [Naganishia onofrii]|uniref:Uncharacterized protein n=1 Tax=Naganishia onofrii TaxID=1851511 RepID=A0ACC2X4Q0_9TREE|nr:hypothetical protein QFC24_005956 [Naganishia onofrii]